MNSDTIDLPAQAGSTIKPKSWRDVLPVHPAADMFPLMERDELLALGQDIKKNGLKQWIVTWTEDFDGRNVYLLDGRNRLDAMEAVESNLRFIRAGPFADSQRVFELIICTAKTRSPRR